MRKLKSLLIWLPALLTAIGYFGAGSRLEAQTAPPAFDVRAHYVNSEHTVSMRDGVKLFTVVYAPKDASQKYPIMLSRTPYSVAPAAIVLCLGYFFLKYMAWKGAKIGE